jgi:hypothetical protein
MEVMFPSWQTPYLVAVANGPQESLRERVDDAERAILRRLEELSGTPGRDTEGLAIREALDALHIIKRDQLDFPRGGQSPVSLL